LSKKDEPVWIYG